MTTHRYIYIYIYIYIYKVKNKEDDTMLLKLSPDNVPIYKFPAA